MSDVVYMGMGGLYAIGVMGYFLILMACARYMKSQVSGWWIFLLALGWPAISVGLLILAVVTGVRSRLGKKE